MIVVSLNISPVIAHTTPAGKSVRTGIFKRPTTARVMLHERGFTGDDQADKRHHGWPTQAAYAFSAQEYKHWRSVLGLELPFGLFGENLTIDGLDDSAVHLGDVYRLGSALMQVSSPRLPCSTLAMAVGTTAIVKGFMERMRVGPYFTVLEAGEVGTGDILTLQQADPRMVSIVRCMELLHATIITNDIRAGLTSITQIAAADSRIKEKALAKLGASA
jgi:MOSC domain-containing protein YiiM